MLYLNSKQNHQYTNTVLFVVKGAQTVILDIIDRVETSTPLTSLSSLVGTWPSMITLEKDAQSIHSFKMKIHPKSLQLSVFSENNNNNNSNS